MGDAELWAALNEAGAQVQGDQNIVFVNIRQLDQVVSQIAFAAVREQQLRCVQICMQAASEFEADDRVSVELVRCGSAIAALGPGSGQWRPA